MHKRSSILTRLRRSRGLLCTLAFACLLTLAAKGQAVAGAEPFQSVLLISWDGTRVDTMRSLLRWQPIADEPVACPSRFYEPQMPSACGEYWTCLPNLCAFQHVESKVIKGRTLTRVQHASMLSGEPPEVTRVTTNSGQANMPPDITIYERLATAFGPTFRQAHIGSIKYTVRGVLHWPRITGALEPEHIMSRGGPDGYSGTSANARLFDVLQEFAGSPFFIFQHQKAADWAGHRLGDSSVQYREAIIQSDKRLGETLNLLGTLGILQSTLVLVTTDHGFHGRVHLGWRKPSVARTWMASSAYNLECFARGSVLDVTPTVLDALGVDPETVVPPMAGNSLLDIETTPPCFPSECGNGMVQDGEECDSGDLGGETCSTLGFDDGSLACDPVTCSFDTSDCPRPLQTGLLEIFDAGTDKADLVLLAKDRSGSGANFDVTSDFFAVELSANGNVLWSGSVPEGDAGWVATSTANIWGGPRFANPSGLVNVRLGAPSRRFVTYLHAVRPQLPLFTDITRVHMTLYIGVERYDHDVDCVATAGGSRVSCYGANLAEDGY